VHPIKTTNQLTKNSPISYNSAQPITKKEKIIIIIIIIIIIKTKRKSLRHLQSILTDYFKLEKIYIYLHIYIYIYIYIL
ncbi:hypothetical protein ACMBCN_02925, partial [Candidatus Liberibacter asiaticus]|nr:hypothetical protein [Candidatus Liberibacter asiaticus]